MNKYKRLIEQILAGTTEASVKFGDLTALLKYLGFVERIKGSHHIYTRDTIDEIINIQSKEGKCKPYQVKQIRRILMKYDFGVKDNE